MARDFEDIHDIDDLDDDELRELVVEHLSAHDGLDIDDITVRVKNGMVILEGEVGTDGERLIAEHVVTDTLGIENVRNDIYVDPAARAETPEAADDAAAENDRSTGVMLGDRQVPLDPEVEDVEDDLDDDLYGTTDVRKATEEGTSWNPPDSPTQEGFIQERGESGEAH